MARERIQKILARAGFGSRRSCEQLIVDGRVRLNGRVVRELGTEADSHKDRLDVDNQRVVASKPAYYVLHKPRGYVTTMHDPEGRPSVSELLSQLPERVFPVGRLDFNTSGALFCTNDGELAHALLHPSRQVTKTYVAKVAGVLTKEDLDRLREGVVIDDGPAVRAARVATIRTSDNATWLEIDLHEGKNRQVHKMVEAIGRRVQRLVRTDFAGLTIEGLAPGKLRPLGERELVELKKRSRGIQPKPGDSEEPQEPQDRRSRRRGPAPPRPGRGPTPARSGPPEKRGRAERGTRPRKTGRR